MSRTPEPEKETVYLGFGSNLGDRAVYYRRALAALTNAPGVEVIRHSALREYPPMGPAQPDYLNGVIEIRTTLPPRELLGTLQRIEAQLERTREIHWGPRTVDLDILFWGLKILEQEDLKIPHPGACERRFVLEPLSELCPGLVDPKSGRTVREILSKLGRRTMTESRRWKLIAVEGPPGSGKTALASALSERLNARLMLDQIHENPFLELFLADMRRYALHTQISSLLSRCQQQSEVAQPDLFHPVTVTDYMMARDEVFAQVNLSSEEYRLYVHLRSALARNFTRPDIVLFLQARSEFLQPRLKQREERESRRLARAYLDKLIDAYGTYFLHYHDSPVLMLDMEHLDLEHQRMDLDALEREMEQLREGRRMVVPVAL